MRERAQRYLDDPTLVRNIIADGCDGAQALPAETMRDVREAMGLRIHEGAAEPLAANRSNVAAGQRPVAKVYGEPVIELPHDLYIPPDALEVFLEAFEGPLDLLLYLIRKQNIDILDIPMARSRASTWSTSR